MFISNDTLEQSSCRPFGSSSLFGQTNNEDNDPLVAPKPFGNTSPDGVFGRQPLSQAFGISSSPAFGASSSPAFGVSSSIFGVSGQSSNSPFGSPSVLGETNDANNDTSASKPSGNMSPFGAQTRSSSIGVTSIGVFGPQPSSLAFGVSSSPAFGASPSPAVGASSNPAVGASSSPAVGASSNPAVGASSSPAVGASSSPFGGSSTFEQKLGFGGFASITPPSPFGSSFQQSQPASRSTPFGSTPFGASSQPAFGSTSTPTCGSIGSAFGVPKSPLFGSSTPAFGSSPIPAPAFGTTISPVSLRPSPFGTASSPVGAQNTPFGGNQATTPAFGSPNLCQTSCRCQLKGSKVIPYVQTPEQGFLGTQNSQKLQSISAMPSYKAKNHEELRWEDCHAVDKRQFSSTSLSSDIKGFGSFIYSPSFYGIPINPFTSKTSIFNTPEVGSSTNNTQQQHSNHFSSSPAFGQQKADTLGVTCLFSPFGSTPSPSQPSPFGSTPTFSFPTSLSPFGTSNVSSSTVSSSLNFGNTASSPLFHPTAPPPLGQTPPNYWQAARTVGPSNTFRGDLLSRNSILQITINNLTSPSMSVPFQTPQPPQNPFGTLPDVRQISIDRVGTSLSIEYVAEQHTVLRISVPTNESPCLNLEIEKLTNLGI